MYQTLYRKYRPRFFRDVVGQEHVTETLKAAIREKRVPHAFLFSGPRGTGKTTTARILAKAISCERPVDGEPCGECSACRRIEAGETMDILELDAASHRGIDEIRELKENLYLRPSTLPKKVYIIDEVHMLTPEAANALLKSLEEPPEHVLFVLATTDPEKVPLTLRSRLMHFAFRPVPPAAIAARLEHVARQEGIDLRPEARDLIAALAAGGLRDALALLDMAAAFAQGGPVEVDHVRELAGTLSEEEGKELLAAVLEGKLPELFAQLEKLEREGKTAEQIVTYLLRLVKDLLAYRLSPAEGSAMTWEAGSLFSRAPADPATLLSLAERLVQLLPSLRGTPYPFLVLQVRLLALAETFRSSSTADPSERRENDEKTAASATDGQAATAAFVSGGGGEKGSSRKEKGAKNAPNVGQAPSFEKPAGERAFLRESEDAEGLARLRESWKEVIEEVKRLSVRTSSWLKGGYPVWVGERSVVLAFRYPIHRKMVGEAEHREHILKVLRSFLGRPVEFVAIDEGEWEKLREVDPVDLAVRLVGEDRVEVVEDESDEV
ncbi:DNA polymerase III subunit gamma/tau [Brockia lithotrophica]|uniref:DNA-directed DNA polymerase n=1 Tax=Brockia lithotrophica TaxID=933949 RepID=A0A660L0K1_9BACL|nr:DNA polymerase III subunit gamma/tau [Brockia lithotrophica]RKQ83930.1 DNA polymerase-3 subunit gamma/tau [Brockia lithotrophica]